jgi:AraC-like DNA-binding protein
VRPGKAGPKETTGVVDRARDQLSQLYLADRNLGLADVAYLLGYSEPAAFIRAFKRWTGRTPRAAQVLDASPGDAH